MAPLDVLNRSRAVPGLVEKVAGRTTPEIGRPVEVLGRALQKQVLNFKLFVQALKLP